MRPSASASEHQSNQRMRLGTSNTLSFLFWWNGSFFILLREHQSTQSMRPETSVTPLAAACQVLLVVR
jgi:hypothetical protein